MNSFDLLYYAYAPKQLREVLGSDSTRPGFLALIREQMTPAKWVALGLGAITVAGLWEQLSTGNSALFAIANGNATIICVILTMLLIAGYVLMFRLPAFMYNYLMYPFVYLAFMSFVRLVRGDTHSTGSLVVTLAAGVLVMFLVANKNYREKVKLSYQIYEAHTNPEMDLNVEALEILASPTVRRAIDDEIQLRALRHAAGNYKDAV